MPRKTTKTAKTEKIDNEGDKPCNGGGARRAGTKAQRRNTGGDAIQSAKYVAHGTNGCVMKPAVPCGPGSNHYNSANAVSKVFKDPMEQQSEWHDHQVVQSIDPKGRFTLRTLDKCNLPSSAYPQAELRKCGNLDSPIDPLLSQIIYEFGGHELDDIQTRSGITFQELFVQFKQLLLGLEELRKRDMLHMDIKPPNILYNADTKKMALIDFGLARSPKELYNKNSYYILTYEYWYYPPELRLFYELMSGNTGNIYQLVDAFPNEYDLNGSFSYRFANHLWTAYHKFCVKHLAGCFKTLNNVYAQNNELRVEMAGFAKGPRIANETHTFLNKLREEVPDGHIGRLVDIFVSLADRVDVYGLGISMAQVFAQFCKAGKIDPDNYPINFVVGFLRLIQKMTCMNPFDRLTALEALDEYRELLKSLPIEANMSSPQQHQKRSSPTQSSTYGGKKDASGKSRSKTSTGKPAKNGPKTLYSH